MFQYIMLKKIFFYFKSIFLKISFIFIVSCEKHNMGIKNITLKSFPSKIMYNAEIIEKEFGEIRYHALSPIIKEYTYLKYPVILFPRGIFIEFFNQKYKKKSGIISADYAKLIELKKYYHICGNVIILTPKGDKIFAKSMFYLQDKKKFFTNDSVKILCFNKSIIYANCGLEVSDDFSFYKLFNNANSEIIIND